MIGRRAGGLCLAGLMAAMAMPARPADIEPFDPRASDAGIVVDLRVAGRVDGRFGKIEGELRPADGDRWRVHVRIDARSLKLDGPAWMQRSTRSEKFLDVERHQRIVFESVPFERGLLRTGGELAGDLSLRGRTAHVSFTVERAECDDPGRACPIRAHGTVSRRTFGMSSQRLWLRDAVGFDFQVRLKEPVTR
jgi:polyisoprenoid-binding protein YceI